MWIVWMGLCLNSLITGYAFLASLAPYYMVPNVIAWIMLLLLFVAFIGAALLYTSKKLLGMYLMIVGSFGCFPIGLVIVLGALKWRKKHYRKVYHFT